MLDRWGDWWPVLPRSELLTRTGGGVWFGLVWTSFRAFEITFKNTTGKIKKQACFKELLFGK